MPSHERGKALLGAREMHPRIRYEHETELAELTEQGAVGLEVMRKARRAGVTRINVCQGDHRGESGTGRVEEEGVLVGKMPECLGLRVALVALRWEAGPREVEFFTEIPDLLLLGFEVVVLLVLDDEI